jgi:hypothetical protein
MLAIVCIQFLHEENDILEKVHLKFCKIILNLKATTPNCMIYGELGRYPLDIDIKPRNILYWSKLITADRKIMFPPLFYYFIHSFNSFFRKMIFTNFKTSSPRKINSQIIKIFKYILEKVHLKFCKIILHLKATTPNCMIYGELGRYPLDIDIKLRNILCWAKLITGKDIKWIIAETPDLTAVQ